VLALVAYLMIGIEVVRRLLARPNRTAALRREAVIRPSELGPSVIRVPDWIESRRGRV
jgi:hypothetical protein